MVFKCKEGFSDRSMELLGIVRKKLSSSREIE
jgi:hypothetical protein